MGVIRLRTMGDCAIECGTTRVGPEAAVLLGLVVYLAAHDGAPVAPTRLRGLFWPEAPDSSAAHSLRQALFKMRGLGIEVYATPSHVRLDPAQVEADFAEPGQPGSAP